MMIELTYLIAALAVGKLGGLDGHALHGHGRFSRAHTLHSPVSMYVVPPDSAFSKEAEGADDEVELPWELLRGDRQRGLQLISLCDLADMMAEQAPGRIRLGLGFSRS